MSDDLHDTPEPDPAFEARVRLALADRVPDDVVSRSRDLFAFASIDAELATLLAEESADLAGAGVRSADVVQTFTFVTDDVTIEVEHDGETLTGQLFPAGGAEVELLPAAGPALAAIANSVGAFAIRNVGQGSWSLVVRSATGAIRTPWFIL